MWFEHDFAGTFVITETKSMNHKEKLLAKHYNKLSLTFIFPDKPTRASHYIIEVIIL